MRYLLFGNSYYYPNGGMADLMYAANSIEELLAFLKNNKEIHIEESREIDWWHIFDIKEMKVTHGSDRELHPNWGEGEIDDYIVEIQGYCQYD